MLFTSSELISVQQKNKRPGNYKRVPKIIQELVGKAPGYRFRDRAISVFSIEFIKIRTRNEEERGYSYMK